MNIIGPTSYFGSIFRNPHLCTEWWQLAHFARCAFPQRGTCRNECGEFLLRPQSVLVVAVRSYECNPSMGTSLRRGMRYSPYL